MSDFLTWNPKAPKPGETPPANCPICGKRVWGFDWDARKGKHYRVSHHGADRRPCLVPFFVVKDEVVTDV